jgi:lauroyl/myristoyl acyltransferase
MSIIKTRLTLASDWLADRAIRGALWVVLRLPFDTRRALAAALMTRIVAPLAGYRRRIRENLALVRPDLAPSKKRKLAKSAKPDEEGVARVTAFLFPWRAEPASDRVSAERASRAEDAASCLGMKAKATRINC